MGWKSVETPCYDSAALQHRMFIVGFGALLLGVGTMFIPLLLPRSDLNKFIVVAGFIASCWGACCLLLGTMDWLRQGPRR